MKSFLSTTSILSSLLLSTVHAQYAIDPNSVDNSTKQAWCQQQQSQCPLICLQTDPGSTTPTSNTCDWVDLTYGCVCSNGLSPNVSEYSQTLPYYICQEWGTQCVANCGNGANDCAANCRQNHPCGALNPTRVNSTSSSSSSSSGTASATGTGTATGSAATTNSQGVIYTGFGGPAASTTGASGAAATGVDAKTNAAVRAAVGFGKTVGTVGLVGALVGGMAVLL